MPGQGSNERILVVEKLRKEFKNVVALKGIDMVVDGPGVYGFLGPNGAGKSTTFKIICSLVRPTSGTVELDGVEPQLFIYLQFRGEFDRRPNLGPKGVGSFVNVPGAKGKTVFGCHDRLLCLSNPSADGRAPP